MTPPRSTNVVVIGAGIVGAACADALAANGFGVTIVDRRPPGEGATAAGMGHVVVMDDSEAQFALTRYSQQLWEELRPELPAGSDYDACGTLWVAADDEEMAEVERKRRFYGDRGIDSEVLDAARLKTAEPNLRDGLAGGLRVPGDSVLYPPVAAHWMVERAKSRGAGVRFGGVVESISEKTVRLRGGATLSADVVVNAAGAWSKDLTAGLPVKPRKGHLVITDRYPGFVRHQLVELGYLKSAHSMGSESVAFNVQPRRNGQLLLGSSRQFGVDSPDVEAHMLGRMTRRAFEYMPRLANLSAIRAWTGFRAATPDKLPLIGPQPQHDGLWLATGHEGLGITTSMATAALLVDMLLGRKSKIPQEPYLPSRFKEGSPHE